LLANYATDLITNTKRCWQTPPHIIKSVAEFASNAWCWLSNLWRSLPTTLGVGYQICGGVCQQRLVLVIKYFVGADIFDNQHQALLANSVTDLITNTKRCWQTPPHI
jgi:hypothetical protein